MKTSTMEPQWWFTSPKEKIPDCGDPIKLDQIPERIYIFSGIFFWPFQEKVDC